jgi:hypothetical protein
MDYWPMVRNTTIAALQSVWVNKAVRSFADTADAQHSGVFSPSVRSMLRYARRWLFWSSLTNAMRKLPKRIRLSTSLPNTIYVPCHLKVNWYLRRVEKNGDLMSRRIEKDGPTGLITATTLPRLHPKNEARLLSLSLDESDEQTRMLHEQLRPNINAPENLLMLAFELTHRGYLSR